MRFYLIIDRASSEIAGFRALTKFSNLLQIAWFKEFIVKKLLCAASFGIALAFSAGAQAADKIAVVNVGEIFQQLPAREAVMKQLENEFKNRASELQRMETDLQSKIQKLQRDGSTMKSSERTKLEKDVMAKREEFAKKAQAFEQDHRRREMEERNKILSRIQDAIKVVAGKEGYDVVIDANAVAYSVSGKNITASVLKQVK
ncbi:periplasmic chaperone for outer membrane proteins Skp [Photorhabdus aegyptia]|uniref:Chaperone protein Skp n=1 Tax=Photorhabdus aegyptia TaxID=2805098 RepID=A0A022PD84_9GAMM|nr:periplasmic chaperone for outer membrane proteins Skp [Photorhabdus aegyptia]